VNRWVIVARQEIRDLWLGGRGPTLVFAFSVLLSAMTYLSATNRGLNFLEQREAVNLTLQVAIAVGVLATMVVAADAISGERERHTLEALLLTPVPRRHVALGKLVSTLTLWAACVVVSVPYLWVLGRSTAVLGQAVVLIALVGTLLAVGLTGVALLVSALSDSNKTSLAVSLFVLLALFAPTQLPGMPKSWVGDLLVRVNPLASGMHYLSALMLNRHTWQQDLSYLLSPALTVLLTTAVFVIAAPRLIRLTMATS
jgi:ABC-2 type transport system permease protein